MAYEGRLTGGAEMPKGEKTWVSRFEVERAWVVVLGR